MNIVSICTSSSLVASLSIIYILFLSCTLFIRFIVSFDITWRWDTPGPPSSCTWGTCRSPWRWVWTWALSSSSSPGAGRPLEDRRRAGAAASETTLRYVHYHHHEITILVRTWTENVFTLSTKTYLFVIKELLNNIN